MPLPWCFLSLRFIGWALDFRWSWTFHCHLLSAFWAVVRIYNCLLLLHKEALRWVVRAILIYETVRKEFQCFEVRQRHCNPIQVFIVTAEHCACTLLFTWAWKALFFFFITSWTRLSKMHCGYMSYVFLTNYILFYLGHSSCFTSHTRNFVFCNRYLCFSSKCANVMTRYVHLM